VVSVRMFLKSRVKLSHLLSKLSSNIKNMWSLFNRSATSCSRKCLSHFQHYLGLGTLNYKIWNKHFGNIRKQIPSHINLKCIGISAFHSIFIVFSYATSKSFKNPFKYFHAVVGDFKTCMVIGIPIACTFGNINVMADEKASLTINESSQIRQIQGFDIGQIIGFKFGHISPFVKYYYSLNENNIKNHAKRLNEKTRKGCDSLNTTRKVVRESRRTHPAIEIWSVGIDKLKVTECLNESARLLAQNLAQTMDEVTRDVLASTSSVLQCANGTNGSTPTELTKADIDIAIKTLLGNDAEMISAVISGTDAFATAPVRPAFFGYIDTDLLDDLEAVSNFLSSANYPNNSRVLDNEWGSTSNVRWLYTSVGSVSSASPAVYNNFIVGKEAYAVVHLGGDSGDFYIEPLGSAGAADPLHQRGSVGWQHPFVSRILNDSFMLNLEATHS
jgi:hypothetical protein